MPTRTHKKTTNSGKVATGELPDTLKKSAKHAQEIWAKAHDSAVETYGEGGRAHRVAFAALKHVYEKKGDRWVKKAEKGPSDPQAARGPTTKPSSTDEPKAPTAGGKVARSKKEAVKKSKEAKREYQRARSKSKGRRAAKS